MVPGMPRCTIRGPQTHRGRADKVNGAALIGSRKLHHHFVTHRVPVLEQCPSPCDQIFDQVLPAQRNCEPDETGARDREDRVDAKQFERHECREGEDCDSDDVAQHTRDGIGTLTLSGVGLVIVAETIETHAPRSFGAL